MSKETSLYKQIDNVEYSRRLLDLADECVAGQGDGRIGVEDAERIFSALENDGECTDLELRTMAYIRANDNWTDAGRAALYGAIRLWNLSKRWK